MGESRIEWTDATWNPVTGCTPVSEGCRYCYAAREAAGRLRNHHAYAGLATYKAGRAVFTGGIRLHPDRLDVPRHLRRPRRIFVNSMSDLFHPNVPDAFIWYVFRVMSAADQHTYQVLTKRAERMADFLGRVRPVDVLGDGSWMGAALDGDRNAGVLCHIDHWPLPNVWLGVSVEDQDAAAARIPHLLRTPAAVRWVSCEPLLGPVNLLQVGIDDEYCTLYFPLAGEVTFDGRNEPMPVHGGGIRWVVVGGESGPRARPMHGDWARDLRRQCEVAGVPFLFKQWGEWLPAIDTYLRSLAHMGRPYPLHRWPDGTCSLRVGRRIAGRDLDGRTWDAYPA